MGVNGRDKARWHCLRCGAAFKRFSKTCRTCGSKHIHRVEHWKRKGRK